MNKNILSQASVLVAMRLPAKQDRDAIEGWIWAPEQDLLARQKFPLIQTFDAMCTPEHGETITAPTGLAEVELSDLRALLEEPESAGETTKSRTAISHTQLEEAERRGYQRGLADGRQHEHAIWSHAWADAKARFDELAAAPSEMSAPDAPQIRISGQRHKARTRGSVLQRKPRISGHCQLAGYRGGACCPRER